MLIMRQYVKSLCWGLLGLLWIWTAAAMPPFNQVVAIVNDDIITRHELDQSLEFAQKERNLPISEKHTLRFQRQILLELITDKIVNQLAVMNRVTISDLEIKSAIDHIATTTHISADSFKETIERQGIPFKLYQEKIKEKLLISKLEQQAITPHIQLNTSEIEEQIKAMQDNISPDTTFEVSHILIPIVEETTLENARQTMKTVIDAYRSGHSFKELAQQYSKAPDAKQGGELGPKTLEELPEIFVNSLKNMNPGEISTVIEGANGLHLIYLTAIHSPFKEPFWVDEVHVQKITIQITPLVSESKARATILNLIQDLLNNKASFEELAKRSSEDPLSAAKGGDLGWIAIDQLPSEIQAGIQQINPGHLSDPIRSPQSWSVVKVLERRRENQQALHQRYLASQILFEKKALQALEAWQAQIRSESYIHILDASLRMDSLSDLSTF